MFRPQSKHLLRDTCAVTLPGQRLRRPTTDRGQPFAEHSVEHVLGRGNEREISMVILPPDDRPVRVAGSAWSSHVLVDDAVEVGAGTEFVLDDSDYLALVEVGNAESLLHLKIPLQSYI